MAHSSINTLSLDPKDPLLVPENEMMRVLEFLGFQMTAGQVDIGLFDQITNSLVGICSGDFCLELIEIKRKWKRILAQCDDQEVPEK